MDKLKFEDLPALMGRLLEKMERMEKKMERSGQPTSAPDCQHLLKQLATIAAQQLSTTEKLDFLLSRLEDLLAIAEETKETSSFVKMIFTQQKPKKNVETLPKAIAVNEFLIKYNKSMKL